MIMVYETKSQYNQVQCIFNRQRHIGHVKKKPLTNYCEYRFCVLKLNALKTTLNTFYNSDKLKSTELFHLNVFHVHDENYHRD